MIGLLVVALLGYLALKNYSMKSEEDSEKAEATETVYLPQINQDDIAAFSYQVDGEYLTFSKIDDQWICSEHKDYDLDEGLVDDIAAVFTDVEATCTVEEPMEMAEYGLDTPAMNISVTTNEGETTTFLIGNKNDITGDYYVMLSDSDDLYMVSSSFTSKFNSTIDSLVAEEEEASEDETNE